MADATPTTGTDGTGANGTDGTPPAATQPTPTPTDGNPAGNATGQDGDTVTLSKEDYTRIISQRDKGNENARTLEERQAQLEYEFYKGKAVDEAAKNYPDVPREVLEAAESPDQMETLAKTFQTNLETAKQKALQDIQVAGPDKLTPAQKADQLKSLEGSGKLAEAIDLKLS